MICLHRTLSVMRDLRRGCGLSGLLLGMLVAALHAGIVSAGARDWTTANPAAGAAVRSAPNFRVAAISRSGTVAIDIFQINLDGTSTKLDTLMASPSGAGSTGTYATHAMAAIYWAYSAAPPPSDSAPPVTVTFYNDTPAVPLTGLLYPSPAQLPFASGDPSLLLNADLRKGVPPGWTATGSGTFDPVLGYTPGVGTGSGLTSNGLAAFANAAALPQGSVVAIFERTGVTIDDSFGTDFWDSHGDTQLTTNRQLFTMRSSSGDWSLQAGVLATSFPQFQVSVVTPSTKTAFNTRWAFANSHFVPGYQDPTFATLLFTWFQNQYYLFFDGHLIAAGTLGDTPIYQMFQDIALGNAVGNGAAGGAPFGAYAIQQLQVSNRFLGPVMAGPVLGLIPDSFATAYTVRGAAIPTGPNGTLLVNDVDAVQTALGLYSGIQALFGQPGQSASFHQIQALMFENYGFFPPIYNAGHPGHGYALAPMDDAYIAALNNAQPTIVMAGGTVNDVSPFTPADGVLIADTETFMNRLSQGGGTRLPAAPNPLLEKIVYLETLSSQALPSGGGYPEPAYASESQNVIALTRAQLPAFKPVNGVAFDYVTSKEWWNESPDYATYLYGSAPADRFNAPGGKDYLNPHPDASGYSTIASHLYQPIRDAILTSAGADLAIQSTPLVISGNTAAFTLTVANAGPLSGAGVVATGIVPAGTVLLAGASSPGCTQSGNTVSCRIPTLAAGAQAVFNVQLQSMGAGPAALTFSVGGANGNDAAPANNSVSVVPPPTPPTPGSSPAPSGAPPAPTALQATAGTGEVTLSWTAASGAASYAVFSGSAAGAEAAMPVQSGIATTSAVISGLMGGTTYFFVVRAVDAAGSSSVSNEVSAAVKPAAPPANATPPVTATAPVPAAKTPPSGGGGITDRWSLLGLIALLALGTRRRLRAA